LQIVPVDQIPEAAEASTDNLIELFKLATKLQQVCFFRNGIGISAVQVGVPIKFFVINRGTSFEYYLNCEYEGSGEKIKSIEGCLSLLDKDGNTRRFEVERYSEITVKGKQLVITDSSSLMLKDVNTVEKGLYSIVFQHEIDHQYKRNRMIDIIGREMEFR
jgi:peptide deformylase